MCNEQKYCGVNVSFASKAALIAAQVILLFLPSFQAHSQTDPESLANDEQSGVVPTYTHMSDALRTSVKKVVVVAGQSPANQAITGSYEKDTPGLIGGMDSGSRIGTISKDVGGAPISVGFPILTIPGAIFGGLSGATKRSVQDFRDELTEELARADSQPLRSDGLALDVFWGLQNLPDLDSKLFSPTTPVPDDTDAVLYVNFNDVTIDVQGKEAIVTISAETTLRRFSDGKNLYKKVIHYQDRDTLGNWTKNENALWRDHANFGRHYLGREVSADVFDRVELNHELVPKESESAARDKKNKQQLNSTSLTPMLEWELTLTGGDLYGPWTNSIEESDIYYDVEIYDKHQLVYAEEKVSDPSHTVGYELEACKTYRWSVRPSYHVGNSVKYGEWMRVDAGTDKDTKSGIVGRKASEAPAYIQDFAALKIECGRR